MSEGRNLVVQGRVLWLAGKDIFSGAQRKDQTGRPITNAQGEPAMQYGFGLAVPKPGPASTPDETKNFMDMWNALQAETMALYPTGHIPPGFSFKYKDGDGVDHNGKPFSAREGYAGHLVYALTTSLPLKFFKYIPSKNPDFPGSYEQVKDGIKCGDYVQVQVNVKGHLPNPGTQGKPGLYLNPNMICFLGFGKEIVNAPDASSVFGAAPPPMPNGASATPVGGPANFGAFGQEPTGMVPQQGAAPFGPQAPQTAQWGGKANPNVLPPQFQTQPQPGPTVPNLAPTAPPAWGAPAPQAPMMQQPGFAQQVAMPAPVNHAPTAPPAWGAPAQPQPGVGAPTPRPPWQQ